MNDGMGNSVGQTLNLCFRSHLEVVLDAVLLDQVLPAVHRAVGGPRPVDEPQVDVVRLQPLQRGVEVAQRRLVPKVGSGD